MGPTLGKSLPPRRRPLPGLGGDSARGAGPRTPDPRQGALRNTSSRRRAERRDPGRPRGRALAPAPSSRTAARASPLPEGPGARCRRPAPCATRRRPGRPNQGRSSQIPLAPRVLGRGRRILVAERNNQIFIRFPARHFTMEYTSYLVGNLPKSHK